VEDALHPKFDSNEEPSALRIPAGVQRSLLNAILRLFGFLSGGEATQQLVHDAKLRCLRELGIDEALASDDSGALEQLLPISRDRMALARPDGSHAASHNPGLRCFSEAEPTQIALDSLYSRTFTASARIFSSSPCSRTRTPSSRTSGSRARSASASTTFTCCSLDLPTFETLDLRVRAPLCQSFSCEPCERQAVV
jgi:hypothetical protein